MVGEEDAIGRHGEIFHAIDGGDHGDEVCDAAPQEGLTAGEAYFPDAEGDKKPDEADEFLEIQEMIFWQEGVAGAEDLRRHAVAAAEIAPICHGDAQIAQTPA